MIVKNWATGQYTLEKLQLYGTGKNFISTLSSLAKRILSSFSYGFRKRMVSLWVNNGRSYKKLPHLNFRFKNEPLPEWPRI